MNWTYADGSDNLGMVPTASGNGGGLTDPGQVSFGVAMDTLLNKSRQQNHAFDAAESSERYQDHKLGPLAVVSICGMILLVLGVIVVFYCIMKRKEHFVGIMHDESSDEEPEEEEETEMTF